MSLAIEFFATDDAVAAIEARLSSTTGVERLRTLVALAWQMRQRDTKRALKLADEASALLAQEKIAGAEVPRVVARIQLIQAEAMWLLGQVGPALALAESSLLAFGSVEAIPPDDLGSSDARWLLSWIALEMGDGNRQKAELQSMALLAKSDSVRITVAQAALARSLAFKDVAAAQEEWGMQLMQISSNFHPAAACWVEDFQSIVAARSSDYVDAIRHGNLAFTQALASGQVRRAIIIATNIGANFGNLNDFQSALEWMQRGLALARTSDWPVRIGGALMQTAEVLRSLQRFDAAADLLKEALTLMNSLSASRDYAIALRYLAEVQLDQKIYSGALDAFRELEQRANTLGQPDLQTDALRGQAKALLELGHAEKALDAAQTAFVFAKSDCTKQIAVLRVLAEIYGQGKLPSPPGMESVSVSLQYLKLALETASALKDYTVPGELLELLAQEYANAGKLEMAFEVAKQAITAHRKIHNAEASNRASAMQVNHETEKARAEIDYQRQMAKVQIERANTLEAANATLEQLGAVGRELTGNLDASTIYATLQKHAYAILDVDQFCIYCLEADGQTLGEVGQDAALLLHGKRIQLADSQNDIARSARDRQEIVVNIVNTVDPSVATPPSGRSLVCSPLLVASRLLGVVVVESVKSHAFGERECSILRSLCAYTAIALVNAEAQAQLLEKNRLLEITSVSDRLTGIFNRLRLDQVLAEEVVRIDRTHISLSVILLDVDHFKSVNDTFGHQVGDQVLVLMAKLLKAGSREFDVVGRWGGEEFLIVCRDTSLDGAAVHAEKLRTLIAESDFPIVGKKTCSFGVAELGAKGDIADLIARADAALYRAKHAGRNRVESFR